MSDTVLEAMRDLIQEDAGNRGLRTDPADNLITACPGDFAAACRSLAEAPQPVLAVVTGFWIPTASPPCGETDGPLGALFLARALTPLGIKVILATDDFCAPALTAGLASAGLRKTVPLVMLPTFGEAGIMSQTDYFRHFLDRTGPLTHLLALERVGPSHTPESMRLQIAAGQTAFLAEVPAEHHDRCHTMRGRDITTFLSPAHRLFEVAARERLTTLGIGDGGNEIGMGKVRWDVLRRNIPGGAAVACRVPTDFLLVAGVSNWGAYALAAGVRRLRGAAAEDLFDPDRERELLQVLVERGPLVDGVTGEQTASVDGLTWECYAAPLRRLGDMLSS